MPSTVSPPGVFKALLILHKALLAGQLIFALVAFYLVYSNSFSHGLNYLDKTLQVVALAFSAGGFYLASFLFKKKLLQAKELNAPAKEKFDLYRSACILQWALIEGPCLLVIISFLLTGNYAFLALAAVLVLVFTMMAPSKLKIVLQLQLTEEEISGL